jgi:glycosyltransferase involved in cell wall biosynthesis
MNPRERRRRQALDTLVDDLAIAEMLASHVEVALAPVAIVIAAYKERDNIDAVLAEMPKQLCELDCSVLVVVDGEDDGTAQIVRRAGCYAVVCPVNRGQGAALRLGYRIAREYGARYVVTADADGQTDPADLETVLEPVATGIADFSNGSRRLGTTLSRGVVRNLGVLVFSTLATVMTRTRVTDTANPIRAFRAEWSARLLLDQPQYQASELLIAAIMSGARYSERPVTMRPRGSGRSKKGGDVAYGWNYGRVFFATWWREIRRQQAIQAD